MTRKTGIYLLSAFILLSSFILSSELVFHLGKNECKLIISGNDSASLVFVSLHENENTAIDAFVLADSGFSNYTLIQLKQNGERLVKYKIRGKDYSFDPNRIFTEMGIKNTLKNYNEKYPKRLEKDLKLFSDSLLQIFRRKVQNGYIVALHNNTDSSYSILSYLNSKDAEDVYINENEDIDDFFFVTARSEFEYFKSMGRNVALQSEGVEDDGSLSVYCQKNGIPYINIEAQHGHLQKQAEMINEVYAFLQSIRLNINIEKSD
ncbi:MAG TPA: hypothetical protein PK110_02255 [Niabella sp.]|nr:hypothetical protein [Chitinophagaceae bacterium]HRN48018.1 hypothetical protein [Niabella sp.]HRO83624.1 hypothetical protein [Niabella sp.]